MENPHGLETVTSLGSYWDKLSVRITRPTSNENKMAVGSGSGYETRSVLVSNSAPLPPAIFFGRSGAGNKTRLVQNSELEYSGA